MKPSINLRYKSLLLTCLLILSAGAVAPAWGQTYTINYKNGSPQTDITERVDTVYIADGEARELFIPELRSVHLSEYDWYVRWYRLDGETLTKDNIKGKDVNPMDDGSFVEGGSLEPNKYPTCLRDAGTSLFWYKGFATGKNVPGASTIEYQVQTVKDDVVFCDVSQNTDYNDKNIASKEFTEPTLSVRYKFVIRPAKEIAERIKASGANDMIPFIKEDIYVPENSKTINIQLGQIANNYAWYDDDNRTIVQGDYYQYRKDGGTWTNIESGDKLHWKQMISSIEVNTDFVKYDVRAISASGKKSPVLAQYKLIPGDYGFMLQSGQEISDDTRRNPDNHPDLYERIGHINFDRGDTISVDELNSENNIAPIGFPESGKWLDLGITEYAPYDYKNHIIENNLKPLQNQYGLFRTANIEGISTNNESIANRKYRWIMLLGSSPSKEGIYDRTYYNTGKKSLGYFFYVDAANLPGRLVKMELDGTICQHTGILVNFWVNDMTLSSARSTLPPNINMNFIGVKKGEDGKEVEVILHRFSSGNALQDSIVNGGSWTNRNIGKWQQLMYTFSVPESLVGYEKYYLEVQNNTLHSNGADYAIDGLRIYRTKPKIDVKRVDVCSSANLTVSTEYELLLQNMGWSIQPDALATIKDRMKDGVTEDSKHIWKYRYGLMGSDPKKRKENLNETIGNVYVGATDKKETGDIDKPEDWITLNTDLKDYANENYNNRSKVYRIIVPTEKGLNHDGFQGLTSYETAMHRQIVVNLRMINDFLYDAKTNVWNADIDTLVTKKYGGPYEDKAAYINYLTEGLETLCQKQNWDYIVPDPQNINIDAVMNGYEIYEQLIRAVCSVMGISRPRVPWWDAADENIIQLSAIDVNKTELRYKGERNFGSKENAASGQYDVVIFSAAATVTDEGVVDFPNKYAGSSFQDPCLLTIPFTVLPSVTIVANTKTQFPEGAIACEGRISVIEKATVLVEEVDDDNNSLGVTDEFEKVFPDVPYTFDWFLGDSSAFATLDGKLGLTDILRSYRDELKGSEASADGLIRYCEENYKEEVTRQLKELLLGDVDNEPRLVIGGEYGKAEFRWTEKVVAIPYLPDDHEDEKGRIWLFCNEPHELTMEAAPAPTLLAGFPDVEYPEGMEYYPYVPLRIGLPNIMEGSITDIPIQGEGLTMGMKESNQLGMPYGDKDDEATTIFLRQGQTYTAVGKLTNLSAKAKGGSDNGGGLFSMTFNEDAYKDFAEGQIYSLYIPFGEYKDGIFVKGSCEGYATLLVKIVPEYLTWQGTNTGEAWYNDANWHQSTKGELYIDPKGTDGTDANGNDLVTAAFAPLHFTRITIPGGQTLELEDLKEDKNLLQGIDTTSKTKATQYIQYDMAVNKNDKGLIVAPYYINKVKAIYFKPEAQLRRQQLLTYDTARVEFEMTPNAKYWMASPLQSVFAGDMYTVKNTGRQNTYAFADITYSTADNDRQAPAFYQKAWDKAITMYVPKDGADQTVSFPDSDLDTTHYEVVQSNWSREYNDVNVPYALGKGFYASVEKKNAGALNGNVLVRLPKADDSYDYEPWKPETKNATLRAAMTKAPTLAERINAGKLADNEPIEVVLTDANGTKEWWNTDNGTVRVIADGDGKHFLLGNPYMYPLDIARFLKGNETILAQKYWTLDTKIGEGLVVGTPDVAWENGDTDATSGAVIAPMQAFFVELKDAAKTKAEGTTTGADLKVVHFDPSMMQGEPEKVSSSLRTATAKNPVLRLTAERDAYRSTALLTRQDDATNSYEADKDAVILLDTELEEIPQVYTIAGTRAVGVNVVRRIDQVPLGVYAGEGKGEVTLTIEGIGDWAETLYLYDAVTRKSTELSDNTYTLRLDGSSHGRYFLSAGSPTGNEGVDNVESISVYSAVSGRVVASASEALKRIQVFTPMGRLVRTLYPARPTYTFDLPAGIYIIRAEIAHDQKTVKLRVQ